MTGKLTLREHPDFSFQEDLPAVEITAPFNRPLTSEITHLKSKGREHQRNVAYSIAGILCSVEGYDHTTEPIRLGWLESTYAYHSQLRTSLFNEYKRQNRQHPNRWVDYIPLSIATSSTGDPYEGVPLAADYYVTPRSLGIQIYVMGDSESCSPEEPEVFANAVVASIGERMYGMYSGPKERQDIDISIGLTDYRPSVIVDIGYAALAGFDIREYINR